jgi:hypothetical protein
MERLVYISDQEFSHIVQSAYPDLIVQERMRLVSEEQDIPSFRISQIIDHPRFKELQIKSLYLGLSDGARTNEIRRASNGEIGNEQIWQAYELGPEKTSDMLKELKETLSTESLPIDNPRFNLIWLFDDFSGSGNSYIRFDGVTGKFKGKIKKIYDQLHQGHLVDGSYYEVFLVLFVATRQAIDHIEYWSERFTSENRYKPLQIRVLCTIEEDIAVTVNTSDALKSILSEDRYYDHQVFDKHMKIGGTADGKLGFAACALPVVLSHNTPNNSIYILWGPEQYKFVGLFPRVSRHREF